MGEPISGLVIGAFGLVPLVGAAWKSYRGVKTKCKGLKDYSASIECMFQSLWNEKRLFKNETRLLVRLALDGQDVEDQVEALLNPSAPLDATPVLMEKEALEKKFEECLGHTYDSYCMAIVSITETIDALQEQLDNFDVPGKALGPAQKHKMKLKMRISYTFRRGAKCKGLLDSLRAQRMDLGFLRGQRQELQLPQSRPEDHVKPGRLPAEFAIFGRVQRATADLHQALASEYFSTGVLPMHHARLFIDATSDGQSIVQSKLMLNCRCPCLPDNPGLLHFNVRSGDDWSNETTTADLNHGVPARKRRKDNRVRWEDQPPDQPITPVSNPQSDSDTSMTAEPADSGPDLESVSICSTLYRGFHRSAKGKSRVVDAGAVGRVHLIKGRGNYRHSFLAAETAAATASGGFKSLDDMIRATDADSHVTKLDQLRLAHSIVSALLKFERTPWLPLIWSSANFAVEWRPPHDVHLTLRTLHLGVGIQPSFSPAVMVSPLQQDGIGEAIEAADRCNGTNTDLAIHGAGTGLDPLAQDMLRAGVDNVTLYSLGLALLNVCLWGKLPPGVGEDPEMARRMAYRADQLGGDFTDIIVNCIGCKFGTGKATSLEKPRLKEAVYKDVYCKLGDMITERMACLGLSY